MWLHLSEWSALVSAFYWFCWIAAQPRSEILEDDAASSWLQGHASSGKSNSELALKC